MSLADDEENQANQILALGALWGALSAAENVGVTVRMQLASAPGELPKTFVRFPGLLKSEYEVSFTIVPDSEVTDGD